MVDFKDRLDYSTLNSDKDLVITIKNSASAIEIPNENVLDLAVDLMNTAGLLNAYEEWEDYNRVELEYYLEDETADLVLAASRYQGLKREIERRKIELQDEELNDKILKIGNAVLDRSNKQPVQSIKELKSALPYRDSFEFIKTLAKAVMDD